MQSLRLQRVQELLKRAIGEVIRRELPVAEAGVITVNDVNVSSDLRSAAVFVGVIGNDAQRRRALELLIKERKRLQGLVGRAIVLKFTPQLRFLIDDSGARGEKLLSIIAELEISNPSHEEPSEDS
ncbi:MAG: 30S ribosome-binding factor RbfA [Verrucomicrobia bacterium]|nr:MAG: 30S ribosome-binding factor RbfA [Verrucomicrobiota bacterium]MCX6881764.1 30S ribosome-binding factor RbfA [Verrucomicrobiota bacterium]MSU04921.1 30S ribosome-binding factor RbfA [Pedosphaera sp.]